MFLLWSEIHLQAVNMTKFSEDITIMTYACEPKTHQWVSSRWNIHSDQCFFKIEMWNTVMELKFCQISEFFHAYLLQRPKLYSSERVAYNWLLRSKLSLCIWHRELTLWFALLTATPIILHTLFLSRHWWTIEGKEDGNRLLTFPLLLFQIWPQYQLLKLLYNNEWAKEKLNYDKKIGSLGNFKIHPRFLHTFT